MNTSIVIAASALLASAPALAQNEAGNAAAAANEVAPISNEVDVNLAPPDAAVLPGDQNATLPADNAAAIDTSTAGETARDDDRGGFPWGLLGLLGLLGLIPRLRRG